MSENKLYLIDATAFCYRAFYALPGLRTSFGQSTNAIYGFINILNKILQEKKPQYLAACFDVSRDTFRQKKFSEYKIQRQPMPEGLTSQIPLIKEVIQAYGISIFEKQGYEADDVIATIAKKAQDKGLLVTIVSSDKDMLQLVNKNTEVFSPYKDEGTLYDDKKVMERFGVKPKQICEIIALMGDDADNIPGAAGIGEKTAVELIMAFGSLEKLLINIDKIKQEKLRKIVSANIENIKLSRELAILDEGVELDFNLEQLKAQEPNFKELYRLFKRFEFKTLLKNLPVQEEQSEAINVLKVKDSELVGLISPVEKLFLFGRDMNNMVFYSKNIFFCSDTFGTNIKEMLADPKIKKIGHDLKKIKVLLASADIKLEGLYFDTMIAGYLLNPSKPGYELVDLSWDYLGKLPLNKPADIKTEISLIVELMPKLQKELHDKSLWNLFMDLEMPLVEVLAAMELSGVRIDTQMLKELSGQLEEKLIKIIDGIYDISGCQFNINSPKQLRIILFEKLKLPVVKKTKTGPSTDEEVLRNLSGAHKLPALLLEYRQLMKLKSTYVDTLPNLVNAKTGRIHTTFNQASTETGRLSSSNPNLQNIPIKTDIGSQIRRAIISYSKDSCLLSCDYSQIELRILAHICNDENLKQAFREGRDIHKNTGSLIYGLEENDVTESMRDIAKRVNFGVIYGFSSYGLAQDLGISRESAQAFIDNYFLKYPKVKEYINQQIEKAQQDGFVTTLLGRRRYIPEINNKNQAIRMFAQRQAINTPIQGSASDLIKSAMVNIHKQIKSQKLSSKMFLQVHDELIFDVPMEELQEFIPFVKEKMENVFDLNVPIKVVIRRGKNWLEMEEVA